MAPTPLQVLRKLVTLANKADRAPTAIPMAEVFDEEKDAEEWAKAWAQARALIAVGPN